MRKAKSKFWDSGGCLFVVGRISQDLRGVDIQEVPEDCRRRQGLSVGRIPQERATAYMQTCRPACRSAAAASWPGMKQPLRTTIGRGRVDWRTTAHRRAHPPNTEPQAELALNGVVEVWRAIGCAVFVRGRQVAGVDQLPRPRGRRDFGGRGEDPWAAEWAASDPSATDIPSRLPRYALERPGLRRWLRLVEDRRVERALAKKLNVDTGR